MKRSQFALSIIMFPLIASINLTAFSVQAMVVPTSQTQTLMSRLYPENATVGQTISWLIWTDPSLPGQPMTLTITDLGYTSNTVIYASKITLNNSGMYQLNVSTAGYKQDVYEFMANTTYDHMNLQSIRYNNLGSKLFIYAYANPYTAIPGDMVNLTIGDFNWVYQHLNATLYQHVNAAVNIVLYLYPNMIQPLESWTNVLIPSSNGSRVLRVSTAGFRAGYYLFMLSATSKIGAATASAVFNLKDMIINVQNSSYFIGDTVKVSIRTYPNVSSASLTIHPYSQMVNVVNQQVPLTNGKAAVSLNSSSWPPEYYNTTCTATVASKTVRDTTSFSLVPFSVNVDTDKSQYLSGQTVNVTTSTTPKKSGAKFTLDVTDSADNVVWSSGPSTLRSDGTAVNPINTNNWAVDTYSVTASVTSTVQGIQYVINDTSSFDIIEPTFDIYATLSSFSCSDFQMPLLNITTVPGQTNANLTITIRGSYYYGPSPTEGLEYNFTKTQFDCSQYKYNLPLPVAPNGSRMIYVTVSSPEGTNSTYSSPFPLIYYSHTNAASVSKPPLLVGSSPSSDIAIDEQKEMAVPKKPSEKDY
jgi:hypothetical protein